MKSKTILKRLFFVYLISLTLIGLANSEHINQINNTYILFVRSDYLLHAMSFTPWFFFARSFNFTLWQWLMMGIIIAVSIEGIQYFLSARTFNIRDMAANLTGLILSLMVLLALRYYRKTQKA